MMDELRNLPLILERLDHQTFRDFSLYVCVNQPESWWTDGDEEHLRICRENMQSLDLLRQHPDVVVIDRCSAGSGWSGKQQGVGWARKLLFEAIARTASDDELVVSLDADTGFSESYLEKVARTMNRNPHASALAVPYYHPLPEQQDLARRLLRYECYMRHYLLSLIEIGSPYAFSALGSAMVFPLKAYLRAGGITPLQGGEDFYLMQKFAKTGQIVLATSAMVFPQGRPSARVPFGTGPAVAQSLETQTERYPFYSDEGFREVGRTFALFPELYFHDVETPMSEFLRQQFRSDDLWGPIRRNFKRQDLFVHACEEKVDGLRILQFLKRFPVSDENLSRFITDYGRPVPEDFSFAESPIEDLQAVREILFQMERDLRSLR